MAQQLFRGLAWVQDATLALATTVRVWWRCRSGHADDLVMEPTRLYLECATCGRQTRGWDCAMTTPPREGRR